MAMIKRYFSSRSLMRTIGFIILTGATQSACFVDRSGLAVPHSTLSASPQNICPADPISVTWEVFSSSPCTSRPSADSDIPLCSTINSPSSSNPETPFAPRLDELSGTIEYNPGPTVDTDFNLIGLIFTNRGNVRDDLETSVNVIDVPASINAISAGLCADNAAIELTELFSDCVEINQICISRDNPSGNYVISGSYECLPGTPPDVCVRGTFTSDAINSGDCISPESVSRTSFQGLWLVDVDYQRDPLSGGGLDPRRPNCEVEGSGYNPDLTVIFQTSCTNAYVGCED